MHVFSGFLCSLTHRDTTIAFFAQKGLLFMGASFVQDGSRDAKENDFSIGSSLSTGRSLKTIIASKVLTARDSEAEWIRSL